MRLRDAFGKDDRRYLKFLFALCTAVYLPSLIVTLLGGFPFDDDAVALGWPWREWFRGDLLHGIIPLWCPNLFCGESTLGLAGSLLNYPPNWPLGFLPPAWNVLLGAWTHHLFLVAGAYVLGRVWGLSRPSAAVAAALLALSAGVAGHLFTGHDTWHASRAYIPWQFACALLYLRSGRRRYVAGLVVLFWWQFLAGYPPLLLLSACGCLYLAGARAWLRHKAGLRPLVPAGWPFVALTIPIATALLGAVMLLPFKEVSGLAVHTGGIGFKDAASVSANFGAFARLLVNDFFGGNHGEQWSAIISPHEEAASIGLIGCVMALTAPWTGRKLPGLAGGATALWWTLPPAAILALGYHTPVYHWLWDAIPPFRALRVPARWMEVFTLAQPFLAAYVFEGWLRAEKPPAFWIKVFGACAGLLGLGAIVVGVIPENNGLWMRTAQWNMSPALMAANGATAAEQASDFKTDALLALLLSCALAAMTAVLLWRWSTAQTPSDRALAVRMTSVMLIAGSGFGFLLSIHFPPIGHFKATEAWPLKAMGETPGVHRYATDLPMNQVDDGLVTDSSTYDGYDPLSSGKYWDFASGNEPAGTLWAGVYQPARISPLLRVAGVDRVIAYAGHPHTPQGENVVFQMIGKEKKFSLWSAIYPGGGDTWPPVYLTDNIVRAHPDLQVSRLKDAASTRTGAYPPVIVDPEFLEAVWIGHQPGDLINEEIPMVWASPPGSPSIESGAPVLRRLSDQQEEIQVSPRRAAVLVQNEALTPGWRVFIDGTVAKAQPANVLFRSVNVPVGSHRVDWVYDPESLRFGLFVSLVSVAGLAGCLMAYVAGRGTKASTRPERAPVVSLN